MTKNPQISTAKAEQTRKVILAEGLQMATSRSLTDVTIGELAKASSLSKSGLYAHFGSKENLQMAIVDYASEIFVDKVIKDVSTRLPPIERLTALMFRWLNWYEGSAKKCLFLSATIEFDDRPGIVREALHTELNRWIKYLEKIAEQAKDSGALKTNADSRQMIFEFYSIFLGSQKYLWLGFESDERILFEQGFNRILESYSA
ncbi:MAG: TetR/AcrR family transcriptional regulator [Kangiellaceae bacterium]|nr:TetR/AcrR family transcriptional regulator [Kangiellaceae bacterium]